MNYCMYTPFYMIELLPQHVPWTSSCSRPGSVRPAQGRRGRIGNARRSSSLARCPLRSSPARRRSPCSTPLRILPRLLLQVQVLGHLPHLGKIELVALGPRRLSAIGAHDVPPGYRDKSARTRRMLNRLAVQESELGTTAATPGAARFAQQCPFFVPRRHETTAPIASSPDGQHKRTSKTSRHNNRARNERRPPRADEKGTRNLPRDGRSTGSPNGGRPGGSNDALQQANAADETTSKSEQERTGAATYL
jgi:hypothetical protein